MKNKKTDKKYIKVKKEDLEGLVHTHKIDVDVPNKAINTFEFDENKTYYRFEVLEDEITGKQFIVIGKEHFRKITAEKAGEMYGFEIYEFIPYKK